jgi:hypothetical protein
VPWFGRFGLTMPVRRGMGQKMGLINGQLGTTPVIPWGVGGGEVGGGGGLD